MIATYDYLSSDGKRKAQKVRTEPKGFYWRYWTVSENWSRPRKMPFEVQLYRQNELRRAIRSGQTVYVADGEKDVDTLVSHGLVATCCPHGSKNWRDSDSRWFRDAKEVVVIQDDDSGHDKPVHRWHGYDGAVRTRRSIAEVVGSDHVRIAAPAPGHKDVTEHFDAGKGLDDLTASRMPRTPRPATNVRYEGGFGTAVDDDDPIMEDDDAIIEDESGGVVVELTTKSYPLGDYGNAERLVARHGQDLRYCHPWKAWLVWDGQRWSRDVTDEIERRAKETIRHMYVQARDYDDNEKAKKLFAHARATERNASRIRAMIDLAESEPTVPVQPHQLDSNPYLLNVRNGTLDLRTGRLRAHSQTDLLTKLAPVSWDDKATCPRWEQFLERILPDADDRAFAQRSVGYSLSGDVGAKAFFLLIGTGDNGKTTFIELIRALLGDYAQAASADLMLAKNPGAIPVEVARLQGARFVSAVETEEGQRLADAHVKWLTGGDRLVAHFKYGNPFEFEPTHKLWLATNHEPTVWDTSNAMWGRIKRLNFNVSIPKSERDPKLGRKLRMELPGILRWAVEGCLAWQTKGLGESQNVREATEKYRDESDVFGQFLREHCVEGAALQATAAALYSTYEGWATDSHLKPMSSQAFGRKLRQRGFESGVIGRENTRIWRGLALREREKIRLVKGKG